MYNANYNKVLYSAPQMERLRHKIDIGQYKNTDNADYYSDNTRQQQIRNKFGIMSNILTTKNRPSSAKLLKYENSILYIPQLLPSKPIYTIPGTIDQEDPEYEWAKVNSSAKLHPRYAKARSRPASAAPRRKQEVAKNKSRELANTRPKSAPANNSNAKLSNISKGRAIDTNITTEIENTSVRPRSGKTSARPSPTKSRPNSAKKNRRPKSGNVKDSSALLDNDSAVGLYVQSEIELDPTHSFIISDIDPMDGLENLLSKMKKSSKTISIDSFDLDKNLSTNVETKTQSIDPKLLEEAEGLKRLQNIFDSHLKIQEDKLNALNAAYLRSQSSFDITRAYTFSYFDTVLDNIKNMGQIGADVKMRILDKNRSYSIRNKV